MCTVSVVPIGDGFRLVCNRDELDARPRAEPPARRAVGSRHAIFPVDPQGCGTWIGANDAGLVLTVLNVSASQAAPGPTRSRGLVIPPLLEHGDLVAALAAARRLDASEFLPFRLVAVQGRALGELASDGQRFRLEARTLVAPRLFTSSSLGDSMVEGPRRRLFQQLVLRRDGRWLSGQERFHAHRWHERPDVSVLMARPGASTVSRCTVTVSGGVLVFEYEPLDHVARAA